MAPPVRLQICLSYLKGKKCNNECGRLHICVSYILGNECKLADSKKSEKGGALKSCTKSHTLFSDHNVDVLHTVPVIQEQLNESSDVEVLQFVRIYMREHRTKETIPFVCVSPSADNCTRGTACERLHVCFEYIHGQCTENCRGSLHRVISPGNKIVLARYAIDCETENVTRKMLSMWYKKLKIMKDDATKHYPASSKKAEHSKNIQKSSPTHVKATVEPLDLCATYIVGKRCDNSCNKLHICRAFILGNACKFSDGKASNKGKACRCAHDGRSQHNMKVLHGYPGVIEDVTSPTVVINNLREYLKAHRTKLTLPLICEEYNSKRMCKFGPSCHRLHVCLMYITMKCTESCGLSHHVIHTANSPCFEEYGIDFSKEKSTREFLKDWYNKLRLLQSSESRGTKADSEFSSTLKVNEICIASLVRNCPDSKSCPKYHDLNNWPFAWQYKRVSERNWIFFAKETIQQLEIGFCNPTFAFCNISLHGQQTRVMYTTFGMQLNGEPYNIRRLSTPSMVQHKHPLATEWIWYDNGAQWFTSRSGISMSKLEELYLKNCSGFEPLVLKKKDCIVDFKRMVLFNKGAGQHICEIRRRPTLKAHLFEANLAGARPKEPIYPAFPAGQLPNFHLPPPGPGQFLPPDMCGDGNSDDDTESLHSESGGRYRKRNQANRGKNKGNKNRSGASSRSHSAHSLKNEGEKLSLPKPEKKKNIQKKKQKDAKMKSTGADSQDVLVKDVEQNLKICNNTPAVQPVSSSKKILNTDSVEVSDAEEAEEAVEAEDCSSQSYSEICTDFFHDTCSKGTDCSDYHANQIFQWQYFNNLFGEWISFDYVVNNAIESEFCNVDTTDCSINLNKDQNDVARISFTDMTMLNNNSYTAYNIKRLSTMSSEAKEAKTTAGKYYSTWLWYYQVDDGKWTEYNKKGFLMSNKIEERFLQLGKAGSFYFMSAEMIDYMFDFKSMVVTKKSEPAETFTLRRRPLLQLQSSKSQNKVSNEEVCIGALFNKCTSGKACNFIHTKRPFIWQHQMQSKEWITFDDHQNVTIERAYCKAENSATVIGEISDMYKYTINFESMQAVSPNGICGVRRLSTPVKSDDEITEADNCYALWVWYQSDGLRWHPAYTTHDMSKIYEKLYTSTTPELTVMRGDACHTVNCKDMKEYDINGKVVYALCRRPIYRNFVKPSMELAICVDFLSSQCLKERRCADYHCLTTYQWQWYHKKRWESFIPDENETLEKKYGSLNNPSCAITGGSVQYDDMTYHHNSSYHKVRRLSTPSSVTLKTTDTTLKHATPWVWYWQDDSGIWSEFRTGSITSENIEKQYLLDIEGEYKFISNQSYCINFNAMTQENTTTKRTRLVKRRPAQKGGGDVSNPSLWTSETPCKSTSTYALHLVPPGTTEYVAVANLFNATSKHTMKQLLRVQNSDLWCNYSRKLSDMDKVHPGIASVRLFHKVIDEQYADDICQYGFNNIITRKAEEQKHENDVHFAKSAASCMSSKRFFSLLSSPREQSVILADVLLGDSLPITNASESSAQPPLKDGSNANGPRYDSYLDQSKQSYIIYDKHQAYPAYLIRW